MANTAARQGYQLSLLQLVPTITVVLTVPSDHPLMRLKRRLNWGAIKDVMVRHLRAAGRNVDAGPGRPLDVDLYVPLLVLMLLKHLDSRHMETLLSENAPARAFIDWEHSDNMQVRDHSTIARIMDSLGDEGVKKLNALILKDAVELGLADPGRLSGDTTAQELPIGYPHEAGILKGLAERCARAFSKLVKKGKMGLTQALSHCKTVVMKAKEYHLFAKGKEAKNKILRDMVSETEKLLRETGQILAHVAGETGRVIQSASGQLRQMVSVGKKLLPQILQWLNTGVVAKGKIIHAGIEQARAIVRNKAGKAVEFGLQYLVCRLGGGYVFGELIEKPTGESKMPSKCLDAYRNMFGQDKTPDMLIYDRGGYSEGNVKKLKKQGIAKVGIQPKGQAPWSVDETDQTIVLSERGKMEGTIGTLKSNAYGFNKPKERRYSALSAAGQKSIISYNLNKLMRDLIRQGKELKVIV